MIKAILGTLVGWLILGCAMEEPESSGTLSLDPNYGQAPEGVTIQDVDHIKDGIIDIKDLVAVAYFHGREVPETEVAVTTEDTDESVPCRNLEGRFPEMEQVTDNTNYRQIFEIDGKKYVYAVLGLRKRGVYIYAGNAPKKSLYPSCVAVRFLLNSNLTPIQVKIKPVVSNDFSEPITSPPLEVSVTVNTESDGLKKASITTAITEDTNYLTYYASSAPKNGNVHSNRSWVIVVYKYVSQNYKDKIRRASQGRGEVLFPNKTGIPIGNDSFISYFHVILPGNYGDVQKWEVSGGIFSRKFKADFRDPFYSESPTTVDGVYVNMSPTEVRRRYFPEDIE